VRDRVEEVDVGSVAGGDVAPDTAARDAAADGSVEVALD